MPWWRPGGNSTQRQLDRIEARLVILAARMEHNMDEIRTSFVTLNGELDRIALLLQSAVTPGEVQEIKDSLAAAITKAQAIV